LAELTGIHVVGDFRSRDIAAGGQGAPLVPAFHDHVLRHTDIHRVILNIGGIANLTDLPPGKNTTGFDSGPGNLLLDAWIARHQGKPYDKDGAWAASGKIIPALLQKLLSESFFAAIPPKSTGRDLFNLAWLDIHLSSNEAPEDVQATLLALTGNSIAEAVQRFCAGGQEIYVCGGGAHNKALVSHLQCALPQCRIQETEILGIAADWMEAIAFAWLAQQTIHLRPANLPAVTGAKHPCVLGAIYPA
jgi:anhydro-N-acetylmuramic acid kinase